MDIAYYGFMAEQEGLIQTIDKRKQAFIKECERTHATSKKAFNLLIKYDLKLKHFSDVERHKYFG